MAEQRQGRLIKEQRSLRAMKDRSLGKAISSKIQRMLRIPWMEHLSNKEVLMKIGTEYSIILTIKETVKISGIYHGQSYFSLISHPAQA